MLRALLLLGALAGVGGVLPANSQLERGGTTDVWFRTVVHRAGARRGPRVQRQPPLLAWHGGFADGLVSLFGTAVR